MIFLKVYVSFLISSSGCYKVTRIFNNTTYVKMNDYQVATLYLNKPPDLLYFILVSIALSKVFSNFFRSPVYIPHFNY